MNLEDFTLKQLKDLQQDIPSIKGLVGLPLVKTYEDFINVLYDDLDLSVGMLEDYRHKLQRDDEDRLTIQIATNLRQKGYDVEHDTQIGGHADLLVKHKNFRWIGEAKIYGSYANLKQGFKQLVTRYTTANECSNQGGMIIYIYKSNASAIMNNWRNKITDKDVGVKKIRVMSCQRKKIAFVSSHLHAVSGLQYQTRHIPVMLYFAPQDLRSSKPRKS